MIAFLLFDWWKVKMKLWFNLFEIQKLFEKQNMKKLLSVRDVAKIWYKMKNNFIAFFHELSHLERFSYFFRNVWFNFLVSHPPGKGEAITNNFYPTHRTSLGFFVRPSEHHLDFSPDPRNIAAIFISTHGTPGGGHGTPKNWTTHYMVPYRRIIQH